MHYNYINNISGYSEEDSFNSEEYSTEEREPSFWSKETKHNASNVRSGTISYSGIVVHVNILQ
jgi:hypothetical protein